MSLKFSDLSIACKKHSLSIKGVAFFLVLALYLTSLWWFEGVQTSTLSGRSLIAQGVKYFGDAAIIVFPFALLKPRFRWTVFIPIYIITLWVIGSIWYFRFWRELPGVSILFLVSNVGDELFHSLIALWHSADFIFILLMIALNLLFALYQPVKSYQLEFKGKILVIVLTIFAFCTGQSISTYVSYKYNNSINNRMTPIQATANRLFDPIFTNASDLSTNGPIVHFFKSIEYALKVLTIRKDLSETDKTLIEDFISSTPVFHVIPDSIIRANKDKNVILILVESLNAEAIGQEIDGYPIAPNLRNMIDSNGSISALNIVTQVRTGCSGDGQLITNTGLHPLSYFSVPKALGSTNSFPALPKILGKENNVVIFTDDCTAWNERPTFSSYGFSPVYSCLDYPELIKEYGGDGAMFNFASKIIPSLQEPFFLELLTASMHAPFIDSDIPDDKLPQLPNQGFEDNPVALDYLKMLNYFDHELGLFIDRLKSVGIYDDTMIVIASDHSQQLATNDPDSPTPMALIIANCGITQKIDRTVGQVDIFPTILNITGNVGPKNYRGVGTSILCPELHSALTPFGPTEDDDSVTTKRLTTALTVSELIHRTNYFAK